MKLKPCPFCGSTRSLLVWETLRGTTVQCDRCGVQGPHAIDEVAAAAWWDEVKRPSASMLARATARLRALRRQQKREAAEAKDEAERRAAPKRAQEREYRQWAADREAWLRCPVEEDTIQ